MRAPLLWQIYRVLLFYAHTCLKSDPLGILLFLLVSVQKQNLNGGWKDAQSRMKGVLPERKNGEKG